MFTDPLVRSTEPNSEPWRLRGQPWIQNHIFFRPLKPLAQKSQLDFSTFLTKLSALDDDFFDLLEKNLPATWKEPDIFQQIAEHVFLAKNEPKRFCQGMMEVFA